MASEAVLQAALLQQERYAGTGTIHTGVYIEVALSSAAQYLALPREWGLTQPHGTVGGAHAGYGVYRCKDGRVAVAALEPHFAAALCAAAGAPAPGERTMYLPVTHEAVAGFFAGQTREQLDRLARERDLPLFTMP
jgi:crotonobetainyl-CoA:carnitine CoA-transferase CaiB-like acyl-CoA transferase